MFDNILASDIFSYYLISYVFHCLQQNTLLPTYVAPSIADSILYTPFAISLNCIPLYTELIYWLTITEILIQASVYGLFLHDHLIFLHHFLNIPFLSNLLSLMLFVPSLLVLNISLSTQYDLLYHMCYAMFFGSFPFYHLLEYRFHLNF